MSGLYRALSVAGAIALCAGLRVLLDSPQAESMALTVAILAALPWSLVLALIPPTPGFSDFAAWCVAAGISVNLLLLWHAIASIARHWCAHHRPSGRTTR